MDLPCLSVNIDMKNYQSSVLEILSVIRPSWQEGQIEIEKLTKGYMNGLLKCSIPEQDAVIIRVFGDVPIFNRESEVATVKLASDKGIFPQLYCRSLANLLHKIHLLEAQPILEKVLRPTADRVLPLLWQNIVNSDYTDVLNDPRYKASLPAFDELEKIWKHMLEVHKQLCESYPAVCCHGDPHIFNTVYNSDTEKVTLLDWEFCCLGPEIMDATILIDRDTEFSEVFHCSESRKKWLQIYLSTHPTYGKEPTTNAMFQQWYRDSLKASMVSAIKVAILFIHSIKQEVAMADAIGSAIFLFLRYKSYEKELEKLEQQ